VNIVESRFHLGYRPCLDGLRGVAILFVLLGHGEILGVGFGFVAVNTFFVLSGFLITCLLVAEWDQSGRLNLRHFYLRRALRLLPALAAMLLAFVVFAFLAYPHPRAIRELHEALYAFFYCTNWAHFLDIKMDGSLGHTWSLSIEEQFYFIWPVLLLFLLRKNSRPSVLCWIFFGAFLSACLRIGLFMSDADVARHLVHFSVGPDMRADSLLLGCFAGVLLSSNLLPRGRWLIPTLKICGLASAAGLILMAPCRVFGAWSLCGGWFLESICAATLITQLMVTTGSPLHFLLENPVLVYVGRISYGLYVWHFAMLCIMREYNFPWQNMAFLLPVFLVTITSYYLIERPCLRLKDRFKPDAPS
jgi:peptidoglycan/LPS O-acetylase OafA/YrhL